MPDRKPTKKATAKKAPAKKTPAKKASDTRKANVAKREEQDRWAKWDKRVRDLFIFGLGAVAFVNELWFVVEPRPAALVAIGAMIGIPLVLQADEKRRDNK